MDLIKERREVDAKILRFERAVLDNAGVTFPQYEALLEAKAHGNTCTNAELASALGLTPGNVSGLLTRLERDGYLNRNRSPEDRRAWFIVLTDKTHSTLAKVENLIKQGAKAKAS